MRVAFKIVLISLLLVAQAKAFSLLGPYVDWMQQTNGLRLSGDIGGPMDLGEEYRWNVPLVTYAFDQSFLDYFGSNGVAAVEQAIQILNHLPPASSLVLSDYPLEPRGMNSMASQQRLLDLKSITLSMLLEQLGLASPTRYVFVLRRWNPLFTSLSAEWEWPAGTIPDFILERNFDPETQTSSHYVNGTLLSGVAWENMDLRDVVEFKVDPLAPTYSTVADRALSFGEFYNMLSRDDVGGLRYLLQTNNVNYETLLPGVSGIGPHAEAFVNGAWRPGVEKITFVRQTYDSALGQAGPITNQYIDTYITSNTVMRQPVERAILRPDFLFSVEDLHESDPWSGWTARTDASHWVNCAAANGEPSKAGPGILRPPVRITFAKIGLRVFTDNTGPTLIDDQRWGSYYDATSSPVVYSDALHQNTNELALRLRVLNGYRSWTSRETFTLRLPVMIGEFATLQTSADLIHWQLLAFVMNRGNRIEWFHWRSLPQRFFRARPYWIVPP